MIFFPSALTEFTKKSTEHTVAIEDMVKHPLPTFPEGSEVPEILEKFKVSGNSYSSEPQKLSKRRSIQKFWKRGKNGGNKISTEYNAHGNS
jgi:hypothetical protein